MPAYPRGERRDVAEEWLSQPSCLLRSIPDGSLPDAEYNLCGRAVVPTYAGGWPSSPGPPAAGALPVLRATIAPVGSATVVPVVSGDLELYISFLIKQTLKTIE